MAATSKVPQSVNHSAGPRRNDAPIGCDPINAVSLPAIPETSLRIRQTPSSAYGYSAISGFDVRKPGYSTFNGTLESGPVCGGGNQRR